MKKLNKKGFTLIELLAVIVILAIVLVVTIPSVLNSMAKARQTQFQNALKTIEDYVEKQYSLCIVGDTTITGTYNTGIFKTVNNDSCVLRNMGESVNGSTAANAPTVAEDILEKTGYTNQIDPQSLDLEMSNGKASVNAADGMPGGNFADQSY